MSTTTDSKRQLHGLPQFRLRTMLIGVTLCGVALAIMKAIGPVWSVVFFFAIMLVALHVIGNAVGTRLRDRATLNATLSRDDRPDCGIVVAAPRPAKRLALHAPLGKSIALLTVLGIAGGGTIGEKILFADATRAALAVGTVSAAILGGFIAFLGSSFLRVGLAALWQAHGGKPFSATPPGSRRS